MQVLEALHNLPGGEKLVSLERHGAHLVLSALVNDKLDVHPRGRGMGDVDLRDLEIDVALVSVKIPEFVLVIFKLLLLEHAAPGEPGERPVPPGLDDLAQ